MQASTAGGNAVHRPHTLEDIQRRIEQHVERLNRWESQFSLWQSAWREREERLDRELAILEAAMSPHRAPIARQLVVVREDDLE